MIYFHTAVNQGSPKDRTHTNLIQTVDSIAGRANLTLSQPFAFVDSERNQGAVQRVLPVPHSAKALAEMFSATDESQRNVSSFLLRVPFRLLAQSGMEPAASMSPALPPNISRDFSMVSGAPTPPQNTWSRVQILDNTTKKIADMQALRYSNGKPYPLLLYATTPT